MKTFIILMLFSVQAMGQGSGVFIEDNGALSFSVICSTRFPEGYNTCYDQDTGAVFSDNYTIEEIDGNLQIVDNPSPMQQLIDEVKSLRAEIEGLKLDHHNHISPYRKKDFVE